MKLEKSDQVYMVYPEGVPGFSRPKMLEGIVVEIKSENIKIQHKSGIVREYPKQVVYKEQQDAAIRFEFLLENYSNYLKKELIWISNQRQRNLPLIQFNR